MKRILALAPLVLVVAYGVGRGPRYDHFVLPAFDGFVYAAMAESPRVFTMAPWGYRILEPWIVHLLPAPSAAVGFFWLNLALMSGAVFLVGAWLRRLGFSDLSAALAAAAFAVCPPARIVLDYQVLVDPLTLFLLAAILHETVDPDLSVLMALFAASALTKEAALSFLVVVPLSVIPRHGWRQGLIETGMVAAPAIALTALLRTTWGNPTPEATFSILEVTPGRIVQSSLALAAAASLSGLILPALVGLFREASRGLRIQAIALWVLTLGLPLINPYHYSVTDLPRLSLFAWPALLPVALAGLGFSRAPVPSKPSPARSGRILAARVSLLIALGAVFATDPYARAPFGNAPDPVAMVGRIRESLKIARRLERGGTFSFEAESGRFAAPVTERFNLTETNLQRWFLYRGFGPDAAFGSGAPAFQDRASILLPVLVPRPARVRIAFAGPEPARVRLAVPGLDIGWAPTDGSVADLIIPAHVLVRGDNIVSLRGPEGMTIRLLSFEAALDTSTRR